jgi:hypothetical protein
MALYPGNIEEVASVLALVTKSICNDMAVVSDRSRFVIVAVRAAYRSVSLTGHRVWLKFLTLSTVNIGILNAES